MPIFDQRGFYIGSVMFHYNITAIIYELTYFQFLHHSSELIFSKAFKIKFAQFRKLSNDLLHPFLILITQRNKFVSGTNLLFVFFHNRVQTL